MAERPPYASNSTVRDSVAIDFASASYLRFCNAQ